MSGGASPLPSSPPCSVRRYLTRPASAPGAASATSRNRTVVSPGRTAASTGRTASAARGPDIEYTKKPVGEPPVWELNPSTPSQQIRYTSHMGPWVWKRSESYRHWKSPLCPIKGSGIHCAAIQPSL